jgi:hypothetical protein
MVAGFIGVNVVCIVQLRNYATVTFGAAGGVKCQS